MDSLKGSFEIDVATIAEFVLADQNKLYTLIFHECTLLISTTNTNSTQYPILTLNQHIKCYQATLNYLYLCIKYNISDCTALLPLTVQEKEDIRQSYQELINKRLYINNLHIASIETAKPATEKTFPTDYSLNDECMDICINKIVDIKWRMLVEVAGTYVESNQVPTLLVNLIVMNKGVLEIKELVCGINELEHLINLTQDALNAVDLKLK